VRHDQADSAAGGSFGFTTTTRAGQDRDHENIVLCAAMRIKHRGRISVSCGRKSLQHEGHEEELGFFSF